MEYQKITNLLGNIPDKVLYLLLKTGYKLMIILEKYTILTSK